MSDATTEGYTATAAEIDGMVRNLCAYALSEPDPLQRYVELTHQQVLFEGIVAALQRKRGSALADLMISGASAAEVVAKTNLTAPAQVTKLIKTAGDAERVKTATAKPPAAAKSKGRTLNMLPPVAAPTERRVLTADERLALGLPPEGPIPRKGAAKTRKKRV
jgi:hypothetical protein